jgi:hypothetical protein
MHDGSLKTLDERVEFLKSLNGEGWQKITALTTFPSRSSHNPFRHSPQSFISSPLGPQVMLVA